MRALMSHAGGQPVSMQKLNSILKSAFRILHSNKSHIKNPISIESDIRS